MSSILCLDIHPRKMKTCPHKNLYTNGHKQYWELPKKWWKQPNSLSIDEMNKQNVIYLYNGILFSLKKEGNSGTCYKMGGSWKYHKK